MNERRTTWKTLAVTAAIALAVSLGLTISRPVELRVDGQNVVSDVPPVTQAHEVFVPLRALAESLGADLHADEKTGAIDVIRGDQHLQIHVGTTQAKLNGAKMTLHHAPFPVRGRVMVGLQTVSRAFGVKTRYDARTARIDVDTPSIIEEGALQDNSP